jgi:hypothetical protein
MLHEFVKKTGVNVSHRYYTEKVEPLYSADDQLDQDEFCSNWVKDNKRHIVKAHEFDIDALSRDIALLDCIRTENARIKEESVAAKEKADHFERENERFRTEYDNLEDSLQMVRQENERLAQDAARLEVASIELDNKDDEIIRLKAMLFDLMTKKS